MQRIDELLEKAHELGQAIAQHERVQTYFTAQQAVRDDPDAQRLLRNYGAHMQHLQQLEVQQQPIEAADRRKAADFETQIAGNDCIKAFMRAQADYVELMNRVNSAISAPLAALGAGEQPT